MAKVERLYLSKAIMVPSRGRGDYRILLIPLENPHLPGQAGGYFHSHIVLEQYGGYTPRPTQNAPPGIHMGFSALLYKTHDIYRVEQYLFTGKWNWGMNGYLEGKNAELRLWGRYDGSKN